MPEHFDYRHKKSEKNKSPCQFTVVHVNQQGEFFMSKSAFALVILYHAGVKIVNSIFEVFFTFF